MGKTIDDKKTMVYRFQRSYHDLAAGVGEEKVREPLVDIYETKDQLRIDVELPGVQKKDIEVYTIGSRLYIRAFRREELEAESEGQPRRFLCLEREFGEFYREVELLVACNTSQGKARFSGGVLAIELPKVADRRGSRRDLPVE